MTSDELRAEMLKLPEPVTDKTPPHWEYWRAALWRHVVNGDDPVRFSEWPCIRHTMLQLHWPNMVEAERLEMLRDNKRLPAHIDSMISSDPMGKLAEEQNNIRQMYHFWKWERVTGKKLSKLSTIVEIGGGYGAGALMARRMGFDGKYIIYDSKEFSLLQQWYLSTAWVANVEYITELPNLDEYENRINPADLMVAIYSLSEMPKGLRSDILESWYLDGFLSLYSGTWVDYENTSWFDYQLRHYGFPNVYHEEARHHNDRDNWYSIGWFLDADH